MTLNNKRTTDGRKKEYMTYFSIIRVNLCESVVNKKTYP